MGQHRVSSNAKSAGHTKPRRKRVSATHKKKIYRRVSATHKKKIYRRASATHKKKIYKRASATHKKAKRKRVSATHKKLKHARTSKKYGGRPTGRDRLLAERSLDVKTFTLAQARMVLESYGKYSGYNENIKETRDWIAKLFDDDKGDRPFSFQAQYLVNASNFITADAPVKSITEIREKSVGDHKAAAHTYGTNIDHLTRLNHEIFGGKELGPELLTNIAVANDKMNGEKKSYITNQLEALPIKVLLKYIFTTAQEGCGIIENAAVRDQNYGYMAAVGRLGQRASQRAKQGLRTGKDGSIIETKYYAQLSKKIREVFMVFCEVLSPLLGEKLCGDLFISGQEMRVHHIIFNLIGENPLFEMTLKQLIDKIPEADTAENTLRKNSTPTDAQQYEALVWSESVNTLMIDFVTRVVQEHEKDKSAPLFDVPMPDPVTGIAPGDSAEKISSEQYAKLSRGIGTAESKTYISQGLRNLRGHALNDKKKPTFYGFLKNLHGLINEFIIPLTSMHTNTRFESYTMRCQLFNYLYINGLNEAGKSQAISDSQEEHAYVFRKTDKEMNRFERNETYWKKIRTDWYDRTSKSDMKPTRLALAKAMTSRISQKFFEGGVFAGKKGMLPGSRTDKGIEDAWTKIFDSVLTGVISAINQNVDTYIDLYSNAVLRGDGDVTQDKHDAVRFVGGAPAPKWLSNPFGPAKESDAPSGDGGLSHYDQAAVDREAALAAAAPVVQDLARGRWKRRERDAAEAELAKKAATKENFRNVATAAKEAADEQRQTITREAVAKKRYEEQQVENATEQDLLDKRFTLNTRDNSIVSTLMKSLGVSDVKSLGVKIKECQETRNHQETNATDTYKIMHSTFSSKGTTTGDVTQSQGAVAFCIQLDIHRCMGEKALGDLQEQRRLMDGERLITEHINVLRQNFNAGLLPSGVKTDFGKTRAEDGNESPPLFKPLMVVFFYEYYDKVRSTFFKTPNIEVTNIPHHDGTKTSLLISGVHSIKDLHNALAVHMFGAKGLKTELEDIPHDALRRMLEELGVLSTLRALPLSSIADASSGDIDETVRVLSKKVNEFEQHIDSSREASLVSDPKARFEHLNADADEQWLFFLASTNFKQIAVEGSGREGRDLPAYFNALVGEMKPVIFKGGPSSETSHEYELRRSPAFELGLIEKGAQPPPGRRFQHLKSTYKARWNIHKRYIFLLLNRDVKTIDQINEKIRFSEEFFKTGDTPRFTHGEIIFDAVQRLFQIYCYLMRHDQGASGAEYLAYIVYDCLKKVTGGIKGGAPKLEREPVKSDAFSRLAEAPDRGDEREISPGFADELKAAKTAKAATDAEAAATATAAEAKAAADAEAAATAAANAEAERLAARTPEEIQEAAQADFQKEAGRTRVSLNVTEKAKKAAKDKKEFKETAEKELLQEEHAAEIARSLSAQEEYQKSKKMILTEEEMLAAIATKAAENEYGKEADAGVKFVNSIIEKGAEEYKNSAKTAAIVALAPSSSGAARNIDFITELDKCYQSAYTDIMNEFFLYLDFDVDEVVTHSETQGSVVQPQVSLTDATLSGDTKNAEQLRAEATAKLAATVKAKEAAAAAAAAKEEEASASPVEWSEGDTRGPSGVGAAGYGDAT